MRHITAISIFIRVLSSCWRRGGDTIATAIAPKQNNLIKCYRIYDLKRNRSVALRPASAAADWRRTQHAYSLTEFERACVRI